MAYRRGFKSEAEAIAREVRRELGLETMDRLDPLKLADHLDISVLCLTDLELAARKHVRYLRDRDSRAFSALTVFLRLSPVGRAQRRPLVGATSEQCDARALARVVTPPSYASLG